MRLYCRTSHRLRESCFRTSMKAVLRSSRFGCMWLSDEQQALDSTWLVSELGMGQELNSAFSSCLTLLLAANNSRRSHAWPVISFSALSVVQHLEQLHQEAVIDGFDLPKKNNVGHYLVQGQALVNMKLCPLSNRGLLQIFKLSFLP